MILIVGAGPTGLALATWLTRLGVPLRIIDKSTAPGTTSRAIGMQARTIEYQRQLGLSQPIMEASYQFRAANLWVQGRHLARAPFRELGPGLSPFPILPYLMFQQDQYERLMIDELSRLGVEVERDTELLDFEQDEDGVTARLSRNGPVRADYLAGCDGAHSVVRHRLKIPFPGTTYRHVFFVADVAGRGWGFNGELHMALNDKDFFGVFPVKGKGRARLIGTIHHDDNLTWEEALAGLRRRVDLEVDAVTWYSTYKVHNRIADKFRVGRSFILGDAAHVHSPVAGQGMNTGIGDAVNLSWKLADALRRGNDGWLDTFEKERIGFARILVWTTDQAFQLLTNDNLLFRWVRCYIVPRAVPFLLSFRPLRRLLFRYISQTHIHYRHSRLSRGRAGAIRGGDRLPWMDNYDPLTSLHWQVHVYGQARADLRDFCAGRNLALHVFPPNPWAARDALYLVRPDGHVALADASACCVKLARYMEEIGLNVL